MTFTEIPHTSRQKSEEKNAEKRRWKNVINTYLAQTKKERKNSTPAVRSDDKSTLLKFLSIRYYTMSLVLCLHLFRYLCSCRRYSPRTTHTSTISVQVKRSRPTWVHHKKVFVYICVYMRDVKLKNSTYYVICAIRFLFCFCFVTRKERKKEKYTRLY